MADITETWRPKSLDEVVGQGKVIWYATITIRCANAFASSAEGR